MYSIVYVIIYVSLIAFKFQTFQTIVYTIMEGRCAEDYYGMLMY